LLWTGLVVAWLVAVAISLVWLWRQAKALMRAASRSADALERLSQTGQFPGTQPATVAIDAKPEELAQIRRQMRDRKQARKDRRRAAHQATYQRWSVLAGWRDDRR